MEEVLYFPLQSVALRSGKYRLAQWSHPMNRNLQYDISNVQTVRIDVDLDNDNTR